MSDDIDKANYADLKTLEDRVRRTLFAHGFNEKTSTPLGDMNSLCRNLVQDAAATDAELAALQARLAEAEALIEEIRKAMGGYPDSDLVSLATTLKVRDGVAEKAEARVGHGELRQPAGASGEQRMTLIRGMACPKCKATYPEWRAVAWAGGEYQLETHYRCGRCGHWRMQRRRVRQLNRAKKARKA